VLLFFIYVLIGNIMGSLFSKPKIVEPEEAPPSANAPVLANSGTSAIAAAAKERSRLAGAMASQNPTGGQGVVSDSNRYTLLGGTK
jgi:hypothetical protein